MMRFRIVLAGLAFGISAELIAILFSIFEMNYYLAKELIHFWSKIVMPSAGFLPLSFFAILFVFNTVLGVIFGYIFLVLRGSVPGEGFLKGFYFAIILISVGLFPYYSFTFLMLDIHLGLIIVWAISDIIKYMVGCTIIERVLRPIEE